MSIFGSRTKHVYTPYSMLLYEEMPGLMRQTVAGAVMGNRNIGKDLITNLVNGTLFRANAYYRKALGADHPWGLPEGNYTTVMPATRSALQAIIEKEVGKQIYMGAVLLETDAELGGLTYEVAYWFKSSTGLEPEEQKWTYNTSSGKYPQLKENSKKQEYPYYPITPIRLGGKNIAESGMPHRNVVRQSLLALNIKVDDLYKSFEDSIKEDPKNEIAEDVYVLLAVSVASKKQVSQEYLFRFFQKMHGDFPSDANEYEYARKRREEAIARGDPATEIPNQNSVSIKDSQFWQKMEWDYITEKIHTGNIAEKNNKYKVEYVKGTVREMYGYFESTHSIRLMHQITDDKYIEYFVHGLICKNLTIKKWVTVSLEDAFENPESPEDGQCFLVPLRRDILKEMGNVKGHDIVYDAIRLYSNDVYTYKLKWYQTGLFKVITMVIAVVVTILYPPAGVAVWSMAMVAQVAITLVINFILLPLVVKMLQNLVGEELALLIAVMATAFTGQMDFSAIGSAVAEGASLAGTLVASLGTTTLSLINATVSAIGGVYGISAAKAMEDIAEMREALQTEIEAFNEEDINRAYDVNATYNRISSDPYQIMEPEGFVKRALMEPQIPTLITATTENFVRMRQYLDTSRTDVYLGH